MQIFNRQAFVCFNRDRILITGGGGYIGSVLVKNLLDQNYNVNVLDSFRHGKEGILNFSKL